MIAEKPLWKPSQDRIEEANLTRFARQAIRDWKLKFNDYPSFHRWSVEHSDQFWQSMWKFGSVITSKRRGPAVVDKNKMPGATWFPECRLNFAENLLRQRDESPAMVFWGEDKVKRHVTHAELCEQVSRLQQALAAAGVKPGDRVAGYLPNMPEAIMAMAAAASLGATWSSCSPDFGVQGVLDRFGQIEPVVLFAVDGYFYNGKSVDSLEKVREIVGRLPSLRRIVVVPYVSAKPDVTGIANASLLEEFVAKHPAGEPRFEQMPFNHPLYILYSSGTTGVPKCIVHGAGGTLLQHMKEQQLHTDVKPGDRLFYFTTLGWMMWNWLASGLASGATLLLYDGSPFVGGGNILFDYADAEGMTHFGTSAKFIDACSKAGLVPVKTHKLRSVRTILSTGSPLVPEGFDYVYRAIKKNVCLSSISGGTDLIGCFAGGNPILPVWRGELQCKALGMDVRIYDENGRPLEPGHKGELVCTNSFPSMPVGFWNDPEGKKYRAAYFEHFPGVWRHGDWCEETVHGGMVIYGRSDAVLNPGGVRIGTAEIYRQVEQVDEVVESLVIGQRWPPGQMSDVRVVLFVKLRDGLALDGTLVDKIKLQIRRNTTPRHVPAKIIQVPDIPRTKNAKIVELAVRNVVHGEPVKNVEALANPEALEYYKDLPELQA